MSSRLLAPFVLLGLLLLPQFSSAASTANTSVKVHYQNLEPVPAPLYNSIVDPILGRPRAPIQVIEYVDIECPACRASHPAIKEVLKKFPGKVSLVYRPFPLQTVHPQAMDAALAADCVFRQGGNGRFWKYLEALFAEEELDPADYQRIAKAQHLKTEQLRRCIQNPDLKTAMDANYENAANLGVNATPTLYVVNRLTKVQKILIGGSPENLTAAIEELLPKATTPSK